MTEEEENDVKPNVMDIKLLMAEHTEQLANPLLESTRKKNAISNSKIKKDNVQTSESQIVIPSDKSDFSGVCSNCNKDFRSNEDMYLEITGVLTSDNVSNPNALVYVYEAKGKENYTLVKQSVFLRNKNNKLAMCLECSTSLTKLYNALKQFTQLCHLQSSIAQKLTELETLQANIYQTKLSDNSSYVIDNYADVKLETTDILFENDSDDFLHSAYDSDFPDSSITDTFEEEDIQKPNISGNVSELPVKNNRPKRKTRQTPYNDNFDSISNTDSENDNYSTTSDKMDEEFKPPSTIKVQKRRNKTRNFIKGTTKCIVNSDCKPLTQYDNDLSHVGHADDESMKELTRGSESIPQMFNEVAPDTCPHCSRKFMDPRNLRKHMRVHTDEDNDKLTCKKCSKKFTREHHLKRHMIHVHSTTNEEKATAKKEFEAAKLKYKVVKKERKGEKTKVNKREEFKEGESDTCPHCLKVFLDPRSIRRHMRIHTDEDNDALTCTVCLKKFTREHHMARHMITVHKTSPLKIPKPEVKKEPKDNLVKIREYQCPVCFESFQGKRSDFQEHVKTHNVKYPYKCNMCSSAFSGPSHLKQHMVRTHNQGKNEYICSVCNAEFGYNYLLLAHQRTQHSVPNNISLETLSVLETVGQHTREQENNRFQCTMCEKAYSRKERLSLHMLSHTKDAPYSCEVCSKRFLQKRSLLRHMILHNDQNPYCCKVCSKYFTRPDHLKRHMESSHNCGKPAKEVQCDVCGKQIRHQYMLKLHKLTHTDERPWTCDICGKGFNHPSTVLAHKKVHSNERKYCCSTCGKTFKRAGQLKEHEGLHLDVVPKPYKCLVENCDKAFRKNSHLVNHALTHTTEKGFVCELCGAAFNRRDNLKVHHRAVHLNDPTAKRGKRSPKKIVPIQEEPQPQHYDYFVDYHS